MVTSQCYEFLVKYGNARGNFDKEKKQEDFRFHPFIISKVKSEKIKCGRQWFDLVWLSVTAECLGDHDSYLRKN